MSGLRQIRLTIPFAGLLLLTILTGSGSAGVHDWTQEEVATMRSLWIESLPPLPPSPSNTYAGDPRAAALGRKFFFDKRFSGNLEVSCGTCHREDYGFTDNLPLAHGMGTTARRTMPLAGSGYFPWLFPLPGPFVERRAIERIRGIAGLPHGNHLLSTGHPASSAARHARGCPVFHRQP